MEIEGIWRAVWLLGGFVFASLIAMLCRGLGKSTEINPEFLANMGFWWSVLPAAMMAASAYYPPLNVSHLAYFGFLFGIIPLIGTVILMKRTKNAADLFGRDDQGRMSFLGSQTEEVVTTVLYGVLAFELTTIFLWDQLYRL